MLGILDDDRRILCRIVFKNQLFFLMHSDLTLSFMLQKTVMSAILITMYALPYYIKVRGCCHLHTPN